MASLGEQSFRIHVKGTKKIRRRLQNLSRELKELERSAHRVQRLVNAVSATSLDIAMMNEEENA